MATVEMINNPADGAANPGGHYHGAEMDNITRGLNGQGVLASTLDMTVTGSNRIVTIPALTYLCPDGSGNTVTVTKSSSTDVTITAADPSDPRTDIITGDSAGNITATAGTPTTETGDVEEAPEPALASDEVMFAKVRAEANTSNLAADKVVGRGLDVSGQSSRLDRAIPNMVEAGRAALYLLGGMTNGAYSNTNLVGIGLKAQLTASAQLSQATNAEMSGGIDMFVTASGDDAGFLGSGQLAVADDWVIGCRIKQDASAASQDFFMGLKTTSSVFTSAENDLIGWRLSGTGNFIGVSDSGGTESTVDSSNNDTSEHTLRVVISGGGATIKFFFDNAQVGSDVTTNIPGSTTLTLAIGVTGGDAADHSFFMSDFYAFRGN